MAQAHGARQHRDAEGPLAMPLNTNLSAELDHAAARENDDVVMARTMRWTLAFILTVLGGMLYAAYVVGTRGI